MQFYTYLYLREDGSPYYVGKGQRNRAYRKFPNHAPPKDRSKIIFHYWSDEETALAYERYLIDFWGRKDIGTGVLRNLTDGGENPPIVRYWKGKSIPEYVKVKLRAAKLGKPSLRKGMKASDETRRKQSEAQMGNTKRRGKKCSADSILRISIAAKKNSTLRKRTERGTYA